MEKNGNRIQKPTPFHLNNLLGLALPHNLGGMSYFLITRHVDDEKIQDVLISDISTRYEIGK